MTTQFKWLRMIAMIAMLAIVATACGSDPEDSSDVTDGVTEEADPVEEATTEEMAEPTEDMTEDMAPTEDMTEDEAAEGDAPADEYVTFEEGDEQLKMSYLLPETGQLAFLGPPIIAGFQLAVNDINEAGGVNGAEVLEDGGDEGDGDGTIANQSVDRLLAEGSHIIMGAAASGISLTVIDKITGAGVAQCSPSNTSPTFTDYDDNGLYFRAAPTDALQGRVMAEQILNQGGVNVAVLARADDYGQGFLEQTVSALEEFGATVALEATYDPQAQNFDSEVGAVVDSGADAVVLVAFDEGSRILNTMIERGVGPADVILFTGDGLASEDLGTLVNPDDPGIINGMYATAPSPSTDEAFVTALQEFRPDLSESLFAAEGYDCAIAAALAAHAAGANSSEAIAANMVNVTRNGTKCTSFAECRDLIDAGEDIDYDGASGPMEFTDAGEPGAGTYGVFQYGEDGSREQIDTVSLSVS